MKLALNLAEKSISDIILQFACLNIVIILACFLHITGSVGPVFPYVSITVDLYSLTRYPEFLMLLLCLQLVINFFSSMFITRKISENAANPNFSAASKIALLLKNPHTPKETTITSLRTLISPFFKPDIPRAFATTFQVDTLITRLEQPSSSEEKKVLQSDLRAIASFLETQFEPVVRNEKVEFRRAITSTVVIFYLSFYTIVSLKPTVFPLNPQLMSDLTHLVMLIVTFFYGSGVVKDFMERREKAPTTGRPTEHTLVTADPVMEATSFTTVVTAPVAELTDLSQPPLEGPAQEVIVQNQPLLPLHL
jgi:hypothetical protein